MQWLSRNNPNTLALALCSKSSDVAAVPSVLQTAIMKLAILCVQIFARKILYEVGAEAVS
jgi:hypothetical protein